MKRYSIIATALAVLLVAALTGGALAQEEGLTLEALADALAALTERADNHEERLDELEAFVASLPTPTSTPRPGPTPTPRPTTSAAAVKAPVEEQACQLARRGHITPESLEAYALAWPNEPLPVTVTIYEVLIGPDGKSSILMELRKRGYSWGDGVRYIVEKREGCEVIRPVSAHYAEQLNLDRWTGVNQDGYCQAALSVGVQFGSLLAYMENWPESAVPGSFHIVSATQLLDGNVEIVFEAFWNNDGGSSRWGGRYIVETWQGCEYIGAEVYEKRELRP